ncbi:MAG: flagellar biosynthesis protein FlhB [Chromatiaceae bacterium]
MSADTSQERTERPTKKRLDEARKKGQVPRSRELNTTLMLIGSALVLYSLGANIGGGLLRAMKRGLALAPTDIHHPSAMTDALSTFFLDALVILAPVLAASLLLAVVGPSLLGGWMASTEQLSFKWERLNPLKGLAKILSTHGAVELGKAIVKLVVVGGVGGLFLWSHKEEVIDSATAQVATDVAHAFDLFGAFFLVLAGSTVLISAVDVPFQIWHHVRQLRMTRQEIRDEVKETEGRPEVKGRIRNLQREIARRRMMEEVPKADVVVTNPSHFAVALRYEPLRSNAPRLVAKGADLMAGRIRMVATANEVPIVEAPPLARALYHSTKIGQEIPASLYLAVAQVLAYVYQLHATRKNGGPRPPPPADLSVPKELAR